MHTAWHEDSMTKGKRGNDIIRVPKEMLPDDLAVIFKTNRAGTKESASLLRPQLMTISSLSQE